MAENIKYLDFTGLGIYDEKLKAWIKSSTADITDDAIRALFVTVAEGPADNEIWYTSSDGNVVTPYATGVFGANIVSNTYEDGKGVIKFDNSVTSIGEMAFYNCPSLTSVTIPNSVTSIGYWAFCRCTSLTSIAIPDSVTSIREEAFYNTGIYNDESNWENGVLYISNCLINAKTNITGAYSIKDSTRVIGEMAFHNCYSLTSITIPNSVTSIGRSAFSNCSALTSITIPNSVTSIGRSAFHGCSGLTSITIPNSVTSIGGGAFENCFSLESVTIGNSVTRIEEYAFRECSALESITFEGTMGEWNAITKGYAWNYSVPATYVQCSDGQVTL